MLPTKKRIRIDNNQREKVHPVGFLLEKIQLTKRTRALMNSLLCHHQSFGRCIIYLRNCVLIINTTNVKLTWMKSTVSLQSVSQKSYAKFCLIGSYCRVCRKLMSFCNLTGWMNFGTKECGFTHICLNKFNLMIFSCVHALSHFWYPSTSVLRDFLISKRQR